MAYYNICPNCGSNLDPGERCDCEDELKKQQEFFSKTIRASKNTGQYSFCLEEGGTACESRQNIS